MTDITRRASVMALGGVLAAPVLAGAARAQEAAIPARLDLRALGAPLDGLRSDSAALRRAMDLAAVRRPLGAVIAIADGPVLVTDPVDLPHYVTLDFGRSEAALRPVQDHAIGIGLAAPAFTTTVTGRLLQLHGAGKTAIAVRDGSGFQMTACDLDLRSEGQTGLSIQANNDPLGPYYGLVDNVRINGTGLPGQTGIVLRQKPATGSIGVNRWIFNNLRHVASLETGIDIQGTAGLVMHNVNLESCHGRAVRMGHGARAIRGRVTAGMGAGGFVSADLAGMALDPVGVIEVLSGANRGESMIVSAVGAAGNVLLPLAFPHAFSAGDTFVFTECKTSGVRITNATYEGGGRADEVVVDFRAGARDCRVQFAFLTMGQGWFFRRAIEDLTNSIATSTETVRFSLDLPAGSGVSSWPSASPYAGWQFTGPAWIDAIHVTADHGSGGIIDVEVESDGRSHGLVASLTPGSPHHARRIRRDLAANAMFSVGKTWRVRVNRRGTMRAERIHVEVLVAYL